MLRCQESAASFCVTRSLKGPGLAQLEQVHVAWQCLLVARLGLDSLLLGTAATVMQNPEHPEVCEDATQTLDFGRSCSAWPCMAAGLDTRQGYLGKHRAHKTGKESTQAGQLGQVRQQAQVCTQPASPAATRDSARGGSAVEFKGR